MICCIYRLESRNNRGSCVLVTWKNSIEELSEERLRADFEFKRTELCRPVASEELAPVAANHVGQHNAPEDKDRLSTLYGLDAFVDGAGDTDLAGVLEETRATD